MAIDFFYKTLFVILTYLFGSFPTAYVIYKLKKGADIRTEGSGNVGGTNIARTMGAGAGITTIILDMVKGFIPMMAAYLIFGSNLLMASLASVAVILGHDFPVYLKFKGGKGIATSFGAIVGMCAFPFTSQPVYLRIGPIFTILLAAAIFFAIFRIVSVCSLAATVATPLSFYFFRFPIFIVITATVWAILALIAHRGNIGRLIRKEEKKIKRKGV
ncbi:MAG: glycerol-3-phosphate 1-O-acyltransferase PlsY [Actinomycetota bacterium]|nr:glycerol-3-phosphate 1-O-acyltransferase PlsY [Actinomycetota bacterium]